MISIRYRDPNELSPGLHAAAEQHGRKTSVYLLSGLTVAQRRAALRRLRISAGRGYGPRLPVPQLALALLADRIRTAIGRAGAIFRSHPAGSTVPVMVLSAGAIAFLALSAVSIQVIHRPLNPGPPFSGAVGANVTVSAGSRGSPGPAAGPAGPGVAAVHPAGQAGSRSSGATGPGTTPGGGTQPTPSPGGDPATAPPSASPTAQPSPTASKTKTCLKLGPLGVCL